MTNFIKDIKKGQIYYEIDFNGDLKCIINVADNRIVVVRAVNGYGNIVKPKDIKIKII